MSKLRKILIGELSWKRMVYSIVSIYLLLLIVAVFFAHKLIFFPPKNHYGENLPHLTVLDDGQGGKLAVVHYKAKEGMPTLLWSHGNAEDIGLLTDLFSEFNELGYGVLAYDYPGYGLSSGVAKEKTCYHAADRAWDYLTNDLGVKEKDVVLLGQSIGSGPTVYLAEEHEACCVILLAPLTSIYRVGVKYPIFPFDQFPNLDRIQRVGCPLLVLHGENDAVIPPHHGKRLIDAHPGENRFVSLPKTDHNDIYYRHLPLVLDEVYNFTKAHHAKPHSVLE